MSRLQAIGRNVHLWGLSATLWLVFGSMVLTETAVRHDVQTAKLEGLEEIDIREIAEQTGLEPRAVALSLRRLKAMRNSE